MPCRFLVTAFFFLSSLVAYDQKAGDTILIKPISERYFDAINKKVNNLSDNLDKRSQRVLARMQMQEAKLRRKFSRVDSMASNNIFASSAEKYKQFEQKLNNPGNLSEYIPKLDSFITSIKFLDQHPELTQHVREAKEKLNIANDNLKEFQSKLQHARQLKEFINERKAYLKEQLEKFGFAQKLKKINKEVYYYSEQLNEYKEIFKDSKKAERKAFDLLSKTKLFKDFMKKNSMLASLFRIPDNTNDPTYQGSLAGLQTRAQLNSLIQNQIGGGGPNTQQIFQQNIRHAQSQLNEIKNKVIKNGGGSSDDILPDNFKPNDQKTKSFWKRLEFGTNLQNQKASNIFPATSDIAFSLGYKLNDKNIIGIGTSYKIGWGRGWNNIRITHQGIGLRSYADIKLKGNFWISGGFEMNYRNEIKDFSQLKDRSSWQQSGLIGMSKTISLKSKIFKKTKLQLLWDMLSYQQIPRSQPIIFRIGYHF